jgi:AcrR family transcriptional regulator
MIAGWRSIYHAMTCLSGLVNGIQLHLSGCYESVMNDKRQAILVTATQLFSKYGYHSVGVDLIIKESGVAKMTMYRYFPSKEELVAEVLALRDQECAASLAAFVSRADTALDRVQAIFEWHTRWFQEASFSGCMFAHAAAEFHEKSSPIHQAAAKQKRSLAKYIENELRQLVSAHKAKSLSGTYVMLLDGAIIAAEVLGQKTSAERAWETARSLLPDYCN